MLECKAIYKQKSLLNVFDKRNNPIISRTTTHTHTYIYFHACIFRFIRVALNDKQQQNAYDRICAFERVAGLVIPLLLQLLA